MYGGVCCDCKCSIMLRLCNGQSLVYAPFACVADQQPGCAALLWMNELIAAPIRVALKCPRIFTCLQFEMQVC